MIAGRTRDPLAFAESTVRGDIAYDSAEWLEAFETIAGLRSSGVLLEGSGATDYAAMQQLLLQGKAAMTFNGSWLLPQLQAGSPSVPFDLHVAPPPLVDGASRARPILSWAGIALPATAAATATPCMRSSTTPASRSVDRSIVEGLQVYSPIAASNDAITNAVAKEFLPMFEDAITPLDWLWEPEITAEIDSQVQAPREGRHRPAVRRAGRRGRREGPPFHRSQLLLLSRDRRAGPGSRDRPRVQWPGDAQRPPPDQALCAKAASRPGPTSAPDRAAGSRASPRSSRSCRRRPGSARRRALAEWLASAPDRRLHTAWLSLDASDNHPASFWAHVIAALRGVAPGIGDEALAALEFGRPPDRARPGPAAQRAQRACPTTSCSCSTTSMRSTRRRSRRASSSCVDHLPANVHLVLATPRRSRAAAGAPAGARRARGGPRRRPAVLARRGRRVPHGRRWGCR